MEIIGIIAEYNPFHNGHLYHINKIKKMYPKSILIAVINGYFLQRGEVSIIPKYAKAKIALNSKVDIVISLPSLYGTQSADNFADASIKLLNHLGCKKIIFGSECNDIEKLKKIACKSLALEKDKNVKENLKSGINYPTVLSKLINEDFNYNPNDLLGICYIKSIIKNNFDITPITIQRTNDYLDKESNEKIVSALNIRSKIKNNEDISKFLPSYSKNEIIKVNQNLLFNLIKITILNNDISDILDVDLSLNNKLKKVIKNVNSYEMLINSLKSKKYTYNKINRMLIHILLNIKKDDANNKITYINILGFNKTGKNYLNSIKSNLDVSLKKDKNSKCFDIEYKSSIVYDMLTNSNEQKKELENRPIIF